MTPVSIALLAIAGLVAGFIAGLVGVGGGVIFAPVLFFYFSSTGISPEVVAQLTLGSSLFCTLIAAATSTVFHYRSEAVDLRTATLVGVFSAFAIFLVTRFLTSQPWYDGAVFQFVFSLVLLAVVADMMVKRERSAQAVDAARHGWPVLFGTGTAAGTVAAAAGVGGGVVLVPAYHNMLKFQMQRAVGTSSATIVLISLVGVLNYATLSVSVPTPIGAVGYVDFGHSAVLAGASVLSARIGAHVAHRVPTRVLRFSFAAIALVVALRLLYGAAVDFL